jgi:hypothetical protein
MTIQLHKKEIQKSADINSESINSLRNNDSSIYGILTKFNDEKYNSIENRILDSLGKFTSFLQFSSENNDPEKKYHFVIDKETLKKINSKEYKILENKESLDEYFGQVRDSKSGKIIKNIPLRECPEINNLENVSSSLQSMAILQSLSKITKQLEVIEKKLNQVIKEFDNDRIGEIQAGYSQLLNALQMEDINLKKATLINAVSSISTGRSKLIEKLKNRIDDFSKYDPSIWNSILREITSKNYGGEQYKLAKEITEGLVLVQRATFLITYIYEELEESKATLQSLAPYNDLINKLNQEKTINNLNAYDKREIDWKLTIRDINKSISEIPTTNKLNSAEYSLEIK